MKPVEYWICAMMAGEPECWDGPYRTADAAFVARNKHFASDFAIYEVRAKKVVRPEAENVQARPKTSEKQQMRPKVRTRSVRPKTERTPRSKSRR